MTLDMNTLDNLIRDAAKRGELTHLSIAPHGKAWICSYAPASTFGVTHKTHADPCEAIRLAITETKVKRRRTAEKPGDVHAESDMDFG